MTRDLFIPTDIISCPIVREKNGLAMSSRNRYFSEHKIEQASTIYQALSAAKESFISGENCSKTLKSLITHYITENSPIDIAYVSFIDPMSFEKKEFVQSKDRVLFAGDLDHIRLIDNMEF